MPHIDDDNDNLLVHNIGNDPEIPPTLHRHNPTLFPDNALPRDRGFGSSETSLSKWLTRSLFCLSSFLNALAARGENLISQVTFGLQVRQRNGLNFPSTDSSRFILQGV